MIWTIIVSLITFIGITLSILFFPKIKLGKVTLSTYWIIALFGALILLVFSLSPIKEVYEQLTSSTSINPLKIVVLFFSMTFISIYLDEVGLFQYLASKATKRAKNNQFALFSVLYLLTAILTIFTSNDIVILTFTPFICFFAKKARINPIPYLVAEFLAANTWSMILIIGNPTNIYLATSANISFFEYFKVMALPTLVTGILEFALLLLIFKNKLKAPLYVDEEEAYIENKPALFIGLIHLFVCLVFLVLSSVINVEMWLISMISALSLLTITLVISFIRKDFQYLKGGLKKLPYQLIPFFLSMFVIVVALNYQGISLKIANFLGYKNTIWSYGYSSFITSNVINNIPMSILFSNLSANIQGEDFRGAIFASIVGSNIGAFLTPMGALAGIMFTNLVNEHGVRYTFVDFIKYGVIIAIPLISVTLLMLSFTISF